MKWGREKQQQEQQEQREQQQQKQRNQQEWKKQQEQEWERQQQQEQAILTRKGYICQKLVGQGAFSRVYCLENKGNGRLYACKTSTKADLLEQEAQIMSKVQHPLFPEYFGVWQEAGMGFLLMEYVPGSTMEKILKIRGHFGTKQALRFGMELADGIRVLHEGQEAFVFRDIKPANVIIRQDGAVKLIDFGCACALGKKIHSCAGTPGFAAPEQLRGKEMLTAACDVYGWGQTMKAMTGILEKDVELHHGHGGRFDRKKIPGTKQDKKIKRQLQYVLDICTQQAPFDRIPDMRGVMGALLPLMPLSAEYRNNTKNRKYFLMQTGIRCEKNIIMIQS